MPSTSQAAPSRPPAIRTAGGRNRPARLPACDDFITTGTQLRSSVALAPAYAAPHPGAGVSDITRIAVARRRGAEVIGTLPVTSSSRRRPDPGFGPRTQPSRAPVALPV